MTSDGIEPKIRNCERPKTNVALNSAAEFNRKRTREIFEDTLQPTSES